MSRSRFGLLAISAMVLGLMAISVASAQAVKPEWMVNGVNLTNNTLLPEVQIKEIEKLPGTEERHLVLLTEILKDKVEILCPEAKLVNVKLNGTGGTTEGQVHFNGCVTKINGTVNTSCKPHSVGAEAGLIITEKGLGNIVLGTGSVPELLIKSQVGETFVTLLMNEACPIGEKVPIKGEFLIKDCNNKFETEEVEHLIEEGPGTHLFVISDTAEHAAKIDGSAWIRLVGAHLGLKWSGLAA
jgi:hypothetical protein